MGFPTPDDNLGNYLRSSTLDKVMYLNGKQYLIMFGTADGNHIFAQFIKTCQMSEDINICEKNPFIQFFDQKNLLILLECS